MIDLTGQQLSESRRADEVLPAQWLVSESGRLKHTSRKTWSHLLPLPEGRTVLILGAGASTPYGYPVGSELLQMIVRPGEAYYRDTGGFADAEEALSCIREFRANSLDQIVEVYPNHWSLVRYGIANIMLQLENRPDLHPQDDWYTWFYDKVLDNDPYLGGGRLSVITFNYDLSFDAHIHTLVKRRHRLSDEQAAERLQNLRLLHVYGHLGPIQTLHGQGRPWGLPKQGWPEPALAHTAATGIIAINDPKAEAACATARELIASADLIVFMGFGWVPANVVRLNVKETATRASLILATAVGVSDPRRILGFLPEGVRTHFGDFAPAHPRPTLDMLERLFREGGLSVAG